MINFNEKLVGIFLFFELTEMLHFSISIRFMLYQCLCVFMTNTIFKVVLLISTGIYIFFLLSRWGA